MKRLLIFCALLFLFAISIHAQMPVKYDSQYKTIYAKDLCKIAQQNPDLVLIDVRTPGEYSDTSQYASLNMGHLKGAINIEIEAMKKDTTLMDKYRDKTVVFYCSHSQRSRRVSKLLSEKGFTNFYNLNGGMSNINQMTESVFPCKDNWVVSTLPYKNLSFQEAAALIKNNKKLVVVDIRPATQFNSNDSLIENNLGRIKGAINIPYAAFKERMNELGNYKNMPIFLYAASGDGDAARAATTLTENGYTKVYHLMGGLNDLEASQPNLPIIENTTLWHLSDPRKALSLLKSNKGVIIYDTRPKNEFEDKVTGMESYKNLGNIKNAVHVEEKDFQTMHFPADKNEPVLIFGRGEAFKLAKMLVEKGSKNVYVHKGMYDFVSAAFNIEDCKENINYLENHEGLY